jgi:peptide-methionine (S)-S-oxide reductase
MTKMLPLLILFIMFFGCNSTQEKQEKIMEEKQAITSESVDTITLGGGCFWCVEAVFLRMKGVVSATSGYSGGFVKNPAYREVCNGTTGHTEVVQVAFNKNETSLEDILSVFFVVHDPTTPNRQGNDVGTQYRSAIYYHDDNQKKIVQDAIKKLTDQKVFPDKIITEVAPIANFYKAEDYHQNYYNQNSSEPYCRFVVKSKVDKFEKLFKDKAK